MKEAAVAVALDGDRFLMVLRAAHIRAPNQYCFPGGGIEPGESPEEAVVRELQEEIGIRVSVQETVWRSQSSWGVDIHWIHVVIPRTEVIEANPEEVASVHWMTRQEVMQLDNLLASNRSFFEAWALGKIED